MPFSDYRSTILELGFNSSELESLEKFIDFLWSENQKLNLVSRQLTYQDLIENHLIDCLLPLKYFPQDIESFADFGSGGGLPGVVYAIHFSGARALLYEKSPLKQEFLNRCKVMAPNLEVGGEIPRELPRLDLVMSRAFKSADVILRISRKYFENGGVYYLFKARRDKIDEDLQDTRKHFKDLKFELIPLKSPVLDVERHLLVLQRESKHPERRAND
jgi:16S rRNA (guanine527-N7)-methyltransferase